MTTTPETGKCETCGGDGFVVDRDVPYSGVAGSERRCPDCTPAASPDPRAVAGSVWRNGPSKEWTFTKRGAHGWYCESTPGAGDGYVYDDEMPRLTFVRGPAPETPAPPKAPTYNHTRGDSALNPCSICWALQTPEQQAACETTPAPTGEHVGSDDGEPHDVLCDCAECCAYHARTQPVRAPEPPAPPPREGSARKRAEALLSNARFSSGWMRERVSDLITAELTRLDGVIGDLERERNHYKTLSDLHGDGETEMLRSLRATEAERDAERSRADAATKRAEEAERERDEARAKLEATKPPVYCKNCPFSRHVHYEVDGKLVTPGCSGFEPMEIDQGKGH